jgi:hypothetical protein
MLHVIADVIGVDLGVFLALLKAAGGPVVRASVVDGLALFQQLERPVDMLGLRGLRSRDGKAAEQEPTQRQARQHLPDVRHHNNPPGG